MPSPLELLVKIMQSAEIRAQIALSKLLLDRRSATVLAYPALKSAKALSSSTVEDSKMSTVPYDHCAQALCFVEVNIGHLEQRLCIGVNTALPRIVFLSDRRPEDSRTALIASRVMHCEFLSQYSSQEMESYTGEYHPTIEVGVGFVWNQARPKSESVPCLSFHIHGPYTHLLELIDTISDIVVLEFGQDTNSRTSNVKCLKWQMSVNEVVDRKRRVIRGQETFVVSNITHFLIKALSNSFFNSQNKNSIVDICYSIWPSNQCQIGFEGMEKSLIQCDFGVVKDGLELQRSFNVESMLHFRSMQLKDQPRERRILEAQCQSEQLKRQTLVKDMVLNPVIKLFWNLLSLEQCTPRITGIMRSKNVLWERMSPILNEASLKVDKAFQEYQANCNDIQAKKQYINAKQLYADKHMAIDNLWRETCHIFMSNPMAYRGLATLAAQHLLDGFPFEILDGDAGMFCCLWVETVLMELNSILKDKLQGRSARIFVLSVMGQQSSGKSTMLNIMFGSELQTSAGRCTRGVYIQLVPSEQTANDYVLLLDTEGIRSPEYFGLEGSEARDNRLATFGILPADATIFMVSNEDDGGLKEVLPMVLIAFKGSDRGS